MSASEGCPFCHPEASRLLLEGEHVRALWDAFPVSPGHALITTRRHVGSWFEATPEEQRELTSAIARVREVILKTHSPDGFNIGWNVGESAGQTVMHLHVHVIPRYRGDSPDPRGGVRHVLKGGNYLVTPELVTSQLLDRLVADLSAASEVDVAVSFVMASGLARVDPHLEDLLDRGGRLRLLTSDYLDITEPQALRRLLDLATFHAPGQIELRVFQARLQGFHPKSYLFVSRPGAVVAYVGSSNLSASALTEAVEWNVRLPEGGAARRAFEQLFRHPSTAPLTEQWIGAYASRRKPPAREGQPGRVAEGGVAAADVLPVPEPHEIQREALAALRASREAGNQAGLVVLATGLGKTWLAAFDSAAYARVLFVAHREEILGQAARTFRRIRPGATLGHYTGRERAPDAEVVLASIQTISRSEHLRRFARDAFDYIVVDEFHHAHAPSYRRLLDHFTPGFLLGLTATPERTDGGDLLTLCGENLVYRCDLVRGVELQRLCPFHYYGVSDLVDYANIPWRSGRFDPEALENAVITEARAVDALRNFRRHGGKRTLCFCCSVKHAEYMAAFFVSQGVRAVAVHAGAESFPRATALERLEAGELEVVCCVDLFNEGVDLPAVDTVLMLRPTESRILWVQQFGRGLRVSPGKSHLNVVDYVGNHRTFLTRPLTLWDLGPRDHERLKVLLEQSLQGVPEGLPPGCRVTYDLEAVEVLKALMPRTPPRDALRTYYEQFRELHGRRPTAAEAYHDGYNPRAARTWLEFVQRMGDLASIPVPGFLAALETTPLEKSYKMLVLLAMLNLDRLPGSVGIEQLAEEFTVLAARNARLREDVSGGPLVPLLRKYPLSVWAEGRGTGGVSYFELTPSSFRTRFEVEDRPLFQELVRELVDWRLAEYLERPGAGYVLRVSQASGRPILFLPDRKKHPRLPEGWVEVTADGEPYQANFVQVAVNVARRPGSEENVLPALLHSWFGPDAGSPRTRHRVLLKAGRQGWILEPVRSAPT